MVYEFIRNFIKKMKEHHISECTAQCAYYTILSGIPLLVLIVTLIQYTGIKQDTLVSIIQSFIPSVMSSSAVDIVQEVYSKSVGTISLSALFVLWSAGKGFYALSNGLHKIYETKEDYNYLFIKIKSLICTIIFVFIIVFMLIFSVFGDSILNYIEVAFNIPPYVLEFLHISQILVYIVLFVIILLMYRFIPGHNRTIKQQIPGAIITTLGWAVISYFFSIYLNVFKGFSVMYGSLTTITITMMWVYFCMYIILIGAEVNNFKIEKNLLNVKF